MTESRCKQCFHYGKSLVTSRVGCVLEEKHNVDQDDPDRCDYFVAWDKVR